MWVEMVCLSCDHSWGAEWMKATHIDPACPRDESGERCGECGSTDVEVER